MLQHTLRDLRDKVEVMHFDALAKKYRMSRAFNEKDQSFSARFLVHLEKTKQEFATLRPLTARPLVGYPIATEEIRCGLPNRMPTLELAYAEAETIALEAAALGRLTPEQAQVLRTFFADLEKNALSVYQAGRMVASHSYDRTEIAKFWKGECDWFAAQLQILDTFETILAEVGAELDLKPPRQTLQDILVQ